MNRKHISLLALMAMMFGASSAMAVGRSTGAATTQAQPGKRLEKLKEALAQLDLSVSQKSQIKQIFVDIRITATSRKATPNGATAGKGQGRQIIQKIMNLLTEPQKMKLKKILKAERSK